MFVGMSERVTEFLLSACTRIVGKPITITAERTVQQFLFYGIGMLAAKFLSLATQVYIGRTLGPEIYGEITIILVIAGFLYLPISNGWGIAFVRLATTETEEKRKYQIVYATLIITTVATVLYLPLLYVLSPWLKTIFGVSHRETIAIIAACAAIGWWTLGKMIFQGFQDWRGYVTLENLWAIWSLALVVFAIHVLDSQNHQMVWALIAGYFLALPVAGRRIISGIRSPFDRDLLPQVFNRGGILLSTAVVGLLAFSIDRMLIHRILGAADVGVYQAHFLATYGLMSTFIALLVVYVFPLFCQYDTIEIGRVIRRVSGFGYPVVFVATFLFGAGIVWIYRYPLSFWMLMTLSILCSVQFHSQLKAWHLVSRGLASTRINLLSQVIFLVVNVLVLLSLIGNMGILAGAIALLSGSVCSLTFVLYTESRVLEYERNSEDIS